MHWQFEHGIIVTQKVEIEDREYWPWQVLTKDRNTAFGRILALEGGVASTQQEALDRATSAYNRLFTTKTTTTLGR